MTAAGFTEAQTFKFIMMMASAHKQYNVGMDPFEEPYEDEPEEWWNPYPMPIYAKNKIIMSKYSFERKN